MSSRWAANCYTSPATASLEHPFSHYYALVTGVESWLLLVMLSKLSGRVVAGNVSVHWVRLQWEAARLYIQHYIHYSMYNVYLHCGWYLWYHHMVLRYTMVSIHCGIAICTVVWTCSHSYGLGTGAVLAGVGVVDTKITCGATCVIP